MNSEDGLDALAAWINEWNTDSDNSSVATANGNALTLANLPLNDSTNGLVGWDFTRYNAEYGTSFAVLAARAHEVPEPAAWILLLTGLLFLGAQTPPVEKIAIVHEKRRFGRWIQPRTRLNVGS